MLIHQIPYHLRHTIGRLEPPIYVDLTHEECLPPARLALGDTLMVLGIIRNQGRPVRLRQEVGPYRELVESHPLVRELAPPRDPPNRFQVLGLPVQRWGRAASWTTATVQPINIPVGPVDRVRANPILAHSIYHGLRSRDDRPSLLVDPGRASPLRSLLGRSRPTLALYPFNPGRHDYFWQDPAWWVELCRRLRPDYALVAVGGQDYGELAGEVDAALAMDDPASTLTDLAWFMSRAAGFLGREGGLYHLAAAVNPRLTVVWDSMASYRFWAGQGGHHILFSNPYVFRYPQTCELKPQDLAAQGGVLVLHNEQGGTTEINFAQPGWEELVKQRFGGLETLMRSILAQREVAEERQTLAAWLAQPQLKARFHADSLDFACRAVKGQEPEGANWVAPVFP